MRPLLAQFPTNLGLTLSLRARYEESQEKYLTSKRELEEVVAQMEVRIVAHFLRMELTLTLRSLCKRVPSRPFFRTASLYSRLFPLQCLSLLRRATSVSLSFRTPFTLQTNGQDYLRRR